jgi:hypothetical protein
MLMVLANVLEQPELGHPPQLPFQPLQQAADLAGPVELLSGLCNDAVSLSYVVDAD